MSFDRHYPNRKDWRRPYRGSAAHDASCRPGGDCPWCQGAREHADARRQPAPDGEDADTKRRESRATVDETAHFRCET